MTRINGHLGLCQEAGDGPMAIAFELSADGRLGAIYLFRNPDKLEHLSRAQARAKGDDLTER